MEHSSSPSAGKGGRLIGWSARSLIGLVCAVAVVGVGGVGEAVAAGLPATSLGVNINVWYQNGQYSPADLSVASAAGVGVARLEAIEGSDMDGVVRWLAQSHVRLYPTLGLPCPAGTVDCTLQTQIPVGTAASEMAQYVTAFAQRYGPKGTFWSANPGLPYLPVESFEIGNEPNIRVYWVQDGTHLHWAQPGQPLVADVADYAEVYEASRTALHAVDPTGVAVVGGLADSASNGVDVQSDEAVLSALPRGKVDAVGFHPWVYDVSDSLLEPDTADLRVWMNQNGFAGVPLDVNEVGACGTTSGTTSGQSCSPSQSSAAWGSAVAAYTQWALCTSWLGVENVQPFVWGAIPPTDQDIWLPLVTSNGTQTAFGQDFLAQAHSLTTTTCPSTGSSTGGTAPTNETAPTNVAAPTIQGTLQSTSQLTGSSGGWTGSPAPTLYYQWERCDPQGQNCSTIAGANSSTYTLQSADAGSTISLLVTAISTAGSATATSSLTGQIAAAPQAPGAAGTTATVAGTTALMPAVGGPVTAAARRTLRSMGLRVVRFVTHGRRVSLTVRHGRGSGTP